jgi:hypothetical protein
MDFSELETARERDLADLRSHRLRHQYCLAATVTPTSRGQDALSCLRRPVVETEGAPRDAAGSYQVRCAEMRALCSRLRSSVCWLEASVTNGCLLVHAAGPLEHDLGGRIGSL